MLPLNYALLKLFEDGSEHSAASAMAALSGEYGRFRAFKLAAVVEALMSAEKNGVLEESRCELDDAGSLQVYYAASAYGQGMIRRYI
jgi:DNA-binding PadR family transcriptional regulator